MATTTTNFGWDIPQSTDLVKDGATAIAALGQDIDTALVDLKGGTTGQVLAKASNTDLDYTWVAQDDSNAIQNAIVDAKGDLIAASAADTPARLAVGNNGETLVADSSTATGLRYQTGYNGNAIINGSMDIWQRGTTFTTTSGVAYTADRWSSWAVSGGGSVTTSRQTVSDTTNLPTIQYCTKFQRVAGNTNTSILNYFYTAESADSYRFAGQTVTLSFYAKRGANFSGASNILISSVRTGTGTDQIMYNFTGNVEQTQNNTLTTTWQRFTQTVTIAANVTEIATAFYYAGVGTAGADDSFSITGVQLELGSVATTFKRSAGGSIQGELDACRRYFQMSYQQGQAPGTGTANGCDRFRAEANTGQFVIDTARRFPMPLRVSPTFTWYSTAGNSGNITANGSNVVVSATYDPSSTVSPYAYTATSIAAGADVQWHWTASAEL